jgi:hypothetical protein
VLIQERRLGVKHFDPVARQLIAAYVDLIAHYRIHPEQQVLKRDLVLDLVGLAVNRMFAVTGQVDHRFAHGLAGDCPDIDAGPADHRLALQQQRSPVQFGGLNRGVMTRRSRADHNQFVRRISHRFLHCPANIVAPDCDGTIARS